MNRLNNIINRINNVLSWLLMAAILVVLWLSVWFAVLGGLHVVQDNTFGFTRSAFAEDVESFLRHWSSHVLIMILIASITVYGIFCKRNGREISKTSIIVLFLTFYIIGICALFGSMFSTIVPHTLYYSDP